MSEILKSKVNYSLEKMRTFVQGQRELIFKENEANFAKRLSEILGDHVTEQDIRDLEAGVNINLKLYLGVWASLNCLDQVLETVKAENAFFLASISHPVGIEKEIIKNCPKE